MQTTTDIERGKRALELLAKMTNETRPTYRGSYVCYYCGIFSFDGDIHADDCVWIQAKELMNDD